MPTATPCPSLETLAAFVEGALDGAERDGMLRHLDACADCRALYVEASLMQEELGPTGAIGTAGAVAPPVTPLVEPPAPSRNPAPPPPPAGRPFLGRRRLAPALAAAVIAVTAGLGFFVWRSAPPLGTSSHQIASAFSTSAATLLGLVDLPDPFRGGSSRADAQDSVLFSLGSRLIDLTLAGAAGNPKALGLLSGDVCTLARQVAAQSAGPYCELSKRLRPGDSPPPTSAELEGLERGLGLDSDPILALGRWTEATRLATAAGDAAYFSDPEIRRLPRQLREQRKASLPGPVDRALGQAETLLAGSFEGKQDAWRLLLDEIRRAFPQQSSAV
jgi:hypothetical protein